MSVKVEWDPLKNQENKKKHGITFEQAQVAFEDTKRIIYQDKEHSTKEERYFCIGKIAEGIVTVRFTYRESQIRIFGAGLWRKGKKVYEEKNNLSG